MNPLLVAAAVVAFLLYRRGADAPAAITGNMVEFAPVLDSSGHSIGQATYFSSSTPRTDLHQPIPYVDGAPDGWALFQLGDSWTQTYTRDSAGRFQTAGALEPGSLVYLRLPPAPSDAPAATTQDPADPAFADYPWENKPWAN